MVKKEGFFMKFTRILALLLCLKYNTTNIFVTADIDSGVLYFNNILSPALSTSGYIKGFRNIFYGSKNEKIELTSEKIRGLSKKSVSKGIFDIDIVEGASQIIIALPEGYTVAKVADKVAFGTDIFSKFELNNILTSIVNLLYNLAITLC